MDKKRILLIIAFIITTFLLGYAIYKVFFAADKPRLGTTGPDSGISDTFPTANDGSPSSVTTPGSPSLPTSDDGVFVTPQFSDSGDEPEPIVSQPISQSISSAGVDKHGIAKFYNEEDGKFYKLGPDGKPIALSDTTFYNVSNAEWSPTREEAIIEYPDGSNIYYNFDTKKQVTLPRHWQEFSFDSTGSNIASKSVGYSTENKWLIISDPEGNNVSSVEPLGQNANKVIVDWSPSGQVLALSRTGAPLGADRQEVLLIGQYGENFKSIIVEGRDLRTEWSPQGEKLLHSVYSAQSGYIPELWVVGASGNTIGAGRKLLGVNTWADKCTFADDRYVYCGVPTSIETGAGFVPALADQTPDEIIRIDTQTGLKQPIETDGVHTVDSIFVGEDGATLFFTDKNQSGLFSVSL